LLFYCFLLLLFTAASRYCYLLLLVAKKLHVPSLSNLLLLLLKWPRELAIASGILKMLPPPVICQQVSSVVNSSSKAARTRHRLWHPQDASAASRLPVGVFSSKLQ
jgi:hypothetical protein